MNEHFRNHGPADNIVLQYVGVCHLMETLRGCDIRAADHVGQAARGGRAVVRPAADREPGQAGARGDCR